MKTELLLWIAVAIGIYIAIHQTIFIHSIKGY